jgi:hypothetical protein
VDNVYYHKNYGAGIAFVFNTEPVPAKIRSDFRLESPLNSRRPSVAKEELDGQEHLRIMFKEVDIYYCIKA